MSGGPARSRPQRGADASHEGTASKQKRSRRPAGEHEPAEHAAVSNRAVGAALGAGAALDPPVRSEMEARFGESFADVRIHDGPAAHGLAEWHLAAAFTAGNHVAFNRDRYRPTTGDGKRLLAHELAHVVQQRRGGAAPPAYEGGALELAADRAAATVAAGSGPVQVGGASAVGIARQPLPDDARPALPEPQSLHVSLQKDEASLKDGPLQREIDRIEIWLINNPETADRDQLVFELTQLHAEKRARRERREAQAPKPKAPDEGSVAALTGIVREGKAEVDEVAEAHRTWLATRKVPLTQKPYSWAEIKLGQRMSRAERYDLMLKLQGKAIGLVGDVERREHDPEFLTQLEFAQEFWERVHQAYDACDDADIRPGARTRCKEKVNEKFGGPGYRDYKENVYRKTYQLYLHYEEQLEAMKYGGPASLGGRIVGYGAGALTGNDALEWSEKFATVASIGDAYGAWRGMSSARSRVQNYTDSGGFELRRDAPITTVDRSAAAATRAGDGTTGRASTAEPSATRTAASPARTMVLPRSVASNDNARAPATPRDVSLTQKPAANANFLEQPAGPQRSTLGPQRSLAADFSDEAVKKLDEPAPLASGFGSNAKAKQAAGVDGTGDREVGVHIDEPLPVGADNVSEARQVQRALDPHNRECLDLATNPQTKHLGINDEIIDRNRHPVLPAVSLKNPGVAPAVVLTRRFDEVAEMHEVFDQAVAKIRNKSKYRAVDLKEKINGNFWDIVGGGKTPAGVVVRDAFRKLGFEYIAGKGMRAVKSKAGGIKPPPQMEVE